MKWLMAALVGIMAISLLIFPFSHDGAWWFSVIATLTELIGVMVWIVAFDSRKRWPDQNWRQRLVRLLTFSL